MVEPEIFFDNNATTRPLPDVCQAMVDCMGDAFGNPSSDHASGHRARRHLAEARGAHFRCRKLRSTHALE